MFEHVLKADASPLYIQRKLANPDPFIEWAKGQGFPKVLSPEELHVTIVYSKEAVNWDSLAPDTGAISVAGGQRSVIPLGTEGAVVLKFESQDLLERHDQWGEAGASWDYEGYQSHVTISYFAADVDLTSVKPYTGVLEFGPEIYEPIKENYKETVVEKVELQSVAGFSSVFKANPYHGKGGRFSSKDEAVVESVGPAFSRHVERQRGANSLHYNDLQHDGKRWVDKDGNDLPRHVEQRLNKLGVPPAYKNVALNPDQTAGQQATAIATTKNGTVKKQYFYSAKQEAANKAEKFARVKEFDKSIKDVRGHLESNLKKGGDSNAALHIISKTGLRIGSDTETGGKHKAYGVTTLQGEHVKLGPKGKITLEFPGKHGKINTRELVDPALHALLKAKKLKPGDRVFDTNDSKTRAAMSKVPGAKDFSPKDFRTWHGTNEAMKIMSQYPEPKNRKELDALKKTVAKHVSDYLNNTPAVALDSYISPKVFDRFKFDADGNRVMPKKKVKKAEEWTDEMLTEFFDSIHYDEELDWRNADTEPKDEGFGTMFGD